MGAASSFIKSLFIRKKLNLLMLGLDSAGKTTILYKLKIGEAIITCPTVGTNIETIRYKKLNLVVIDISGAERMRRFWKLHYKNTSGIIFVIDAEDRRSLQISKEELSNLFACKELQNVPALIFANKQDLPNAMNAYEIVEKLELFKVRDRQWHLQATCALTGEGLEEGIARLVQMVNKGK